jgi:hypothetical protein
MKLDEYHEALQRDKERFETFLTGMDSRVAAGFGTEPEDEFEKSRMYKNLGTVEPILCRY